MPNLYVYDTGRRATSQITMSFARGITTDQRWSVKHIPIAQYLKDGIPQTFIPGVDAVASLGILRGTGLMFKEAQSRGLDYYYMDHAYFNPGYGGKGWMRIVKNGHSCTDLRDYANDRWKMFFEGNNPCMGWLRNEQRGSKIIICPPTDAIRWYMGINYDWAEMIKDRLETMLPTEQHHRIVIRRKPKEPIVDERGNLVELRVYPQEGTLEDDLNDAHCVIAYNSMVALTATVKGIPVITSDHSCCCKVSFCLEDFANSPYPDKFNTEPKNRIPLLYWLSANQWKMKEIEEGTAWQHLQEHYSGI